MVIPRVDLVHDGATNEHQDKSHAHHHDQGNEQVGTHTGEIALGVHGVEHEPTNNGGGDADDDEDGCGLELNAYHTDEQTLADGEGGQDEVVRGVFAQLLGGTSQT